MGGEVRTLSKLLSVPEAAERLRVSPTWLYHLASAKQIRFVKLGRRVLFREEDLLAWVEASEVAPLAIKAVQPNQAAAPAGGQ